MGQITAVKISFNFYLFLNTRNLDKKLINDKTPYIQSNKFTLVKKNTTTLLVMLKTFIRSAPLYHHCNPIVAPLYPQCTCKRMSQQQQQQDWSDHFPHTACHSGHHPSHASHQLSHSHVFSKTLTDGRIISTFVTVKQLKCPHYCIPPPSTFNSDGHFASWVIPYEITEKNVTIFFLFFLPKKSKVYDILVIKNVFSIFFCYF